MRQDSYDEISDEQWKKIEPLLPLKNRKNRGRPPISPRATVNGILWLIRHPTETYNLPKAYGSERTLHNRIVEWDQNGCLEPLLRTLAKDEPISSEDLRSLCEEISKENDSKEVQNIPD